MMLATVDLAPPQVKAGRVKVLAVSSAQRLASLPEIPMIVESGFAGFVAEGWYGLLLPARTSPEIARRHNDEVNRALKSSRLRDGLQQGGVAPLGARAEAFEAQMRDQQWVWAKIVHDDGIRPE